MGVARLNESQRRALAVSLRLLEERLTAIVGRLAMSWETLGEVDARGMRACGEVDPAVPGILHPVMQRLMDLVLALETAVRPLARDRH